MAMATDTPSPGRRYFTVRELLVVVTILAIGFAVLVPAIRNARDVNHRQQCTNNLRVIGLGLQDFHDIRQEICPSYLTDDHSPAAIPKGFITWPILLLPWMEDSDTNWYELSHQTVPLDEDAAAPADHALIRMSDFWIYHCPARRTSSANLGDYANVSLANARKDRIDFSSPRNWDAAMLPCRAFNTSQSPNTVQLDVFAPGTLLGGEYRSMTSFASIKDGLSYTAFIGEKAVHQDRLGGRGTDLAQAVLPSHQDGTFYYGRGGNPADLKAPGAMAFWSRRLAPAETGERLLPAKPRLEDPNNRFGGWHPGVTLFLLGDGSVKAVNNDTATIVLQRLGCRNDGQQVDLP
jgi:hypothetical protein